MSALLAATDLDRTLIYSRAAWARPDPAPGADPTDGLLCVEKLDGAPLSYLTRRAAELIERLREVAVLVPVTTRTEAQFARVVLPGGPTRYAITTNGARLLVDGAADPDWTAAVARRTADGCAPLTEVAAMLAALPPQWLLRVRDAQQAFCYAILDRAAAPEDELERVREWCAERGWTASVQGRKLYCVPEPLTKTAAVQEVARRAGTSTVAAAGDSLLDAGMLAAADVAIRPAHGELHAAGWTRPGLRIAAEGVRGGEQIVAWLLEQAQAGAAAEPPDQAPDQPARSRATIAAAPARTAASSSR